MAEGQSVSVQLRKEKDLNKCSEFSVKQHFADSLL